MKVRSLSPGALRATFPVVAILAAITAGVVFGVEIALLVVAGSALLGVVALLWASVQSLTGEAPITLEEALGLGAPSAEEEQKRAVLRALKDVEFERSVGKISEEDYAELSARYREDAKRLMQSLDQSSEPARERVDKLVAERLAKEKRAGKRPAEAPPRADEDADTADSPASGSSTSASPAPESERAPAEPPASSSEVPANTAVTRQAGGESS